MTQPLPHDGATVTHDERIRRYPLRLPDPMFRRVGTWAASNRRSVNAELATLIDEALEARERTAAGNG